MISKFGRLLIVLPLVFSACRTGSDSSSGTEEDLVEKARAIHERVITIDTHDDIPFNFASPEVDPGVRGDRQVDIEKMEEGGLDVAFFVVYVGQTERTPENYERAKADALTKFEAIHRMAEEMYPDKIEIPYTADDVERILSEGKKVAAIGIENGFVIGKDLSLLQRYQELGARYMTLAHGGHNDIADSATPRENLDESEEEHGGLSEFGEEVVAEMNRVGILVDVSHISKNAMLDAVRVSKAPVIASHSSVRALCDVPRNMDDEQLLALAENGGVIQMVALDRFVKKWPQEKQDAVDQVRQDLGITSRAAFRTMTDEQRQQYQDRLKEITEIWPRTNVSEYVDHIDYAVNLMGIEHVGISSDFDGGGGIDGWNDASETFNITVELFRRGYTEEEIEMIWSGNTLRIWREMERVSSELKGEV